MKSISFSPPDITENEIAAVTEVLRSGWITTGRCVREFEEGLSQYVGTDRTVCVSSATAAMDMVLFCMGIKEGDEVITTAYTYTASASVIAHCGAKIILADTKANSFEMDYDKLADLITEKTKMIIAVDLAGIPCDYDRIFEAAESKKTLYTPSTEYQKCFDRVPVMTDAAHALGASYKGCPVGSVADFTCFSFHAVKNLTTAEGGALTFKKNKNIDSDRLYKEICTYILHGQTKDAFSKTGAGNWEYDVVYPAFKSNMTDIAAAMGLSQLKRYDKTLERRREIVKLYNKSLIPLGVQPINHFKTDSLSSCHLYMVRLPEADESKRNKIIVRMAECKIACNVHYKPLPMLSAYKNMGFSIFDFQNSFNQYKNEITLPLHNKLSDDDVCYIIEKFSGILGEQKCTDI